MLLTYEQLTFELRKK